MTSPEDTAAETAAPACHMPGHPGPAGHVHACQLCPVSPTYWRGQAATHSTGGMQSCQWTPPTAAEAKP